MIEEATMICLRIKQSIERRYVERFAHLGFMEERVIGMAFYEKEVAMDFGRLGLGRARGLSTKKSSLIG